MEYQKYKNEIIEDIKTCLEKYKRQPILFIGSGFSKRFFNGPSWDELLNKMKETCPLIKKNIAYYKQKGMDSIKIGSEFSNLFHEWAWNEGRNSFPSEVFHDNLKQSFYLKYKIAEYFKKITPEDISSITDKNLIKELSLIKEISPYAIITTNYDRFLEVIFPNFTPIIGQQIIKENVIVIGEIFKIHGCSSDPQSIVITSEDYEEFKNKKKYLSAKLYTLFCEHPLIIIGYTAKDPNIQAILSDFDEILSNNDKLVENIYLLDWTKEIQPTPPFPKEKILSLDNNKTLRIKNIYTDKFDWVFSAFKSECKPEMYNVSILRNLLSHIYTLVRCDIPAKKLEVNYETLEQTLQSEDQTAKILGISVANNSDLNITHPFSITQIAEKLNFKHWNKINQLIDRINDEKKYNIKQSDNQYHYAVKTGSKSITHKYSQNAVLLLEKVKNNIEYDLQIN
ncbi:MAG: SIR2 family protein [Magnetococcales bacterium]|nr:SIR2 family protein [Magnetococcales bacterium]